MILKIQRKSHLLISLVVKPVNEVQSCIELYRIDRYGRLTPLTVDDFLKLYKEIAPALNEISPIWLEIKNKRQFYEAVTEAPYVHRWRNHLKARTMVLKSAHNRRMNIDQNRKN